MGTFYTVKKNYARRYGTTHSNKSAVKVYINRLKWLVVSLFHCKYLRPESKTSDIVCIYEGHCMVFCLSNRFTNSFMFGIILKRYLFSML